MSYEFRIVSMKKMKLSVLQFIILNSSFIILLSSCSVQKQIHQSAKTDVLATKALQTAHVGISIFDPSANKYLYNYQGDHYFVPASNTKIPTCYAAMKYLGDSLVGLRYAVSESKIYKHSILALQPTGDPTLLHPDFFIQPVWNFFKENASTYKVNTALMMDLWDDNHFGSGWSWNDYQESYMAERNDFPIYGNLIEVKINSLANRKLGDTSRFDLGEFPRDLFKTQHIFFDSLVNLTSFNPISKENYLKQFPYIKIKREINENRFSFSEGRNSFKSLLIPFVTKNQEVSKQIVKSDLGIYLGRLLKYSFRGAKDEYSVDVYSLGDHSDFIKVDQWKKINSQPTDSVLKPMMHRSDNFFAEQMLLMVSNEMLGVMNDAKIIDTILKTDFKDLPQKPRWVDGSGLSRYNLFSPQDFVAILNKMKNEFGMDRIKEIFPTGGEGTISNYYKSDSSFIYGKTGTLSGVVAFSGFLYTKKGKLLIFSTLVNNHNDSATDVRRAIEKFLQGVRNKY